MLSMRMGDVLLTVQELYHYAKIYFLGNAYNLRSVEKNIFSKRCVNVRKLENNQFLAMDLTFEHHDKQPFII